MASSRAVAQQPDTAVLLSAATFTRQVAELTADSLQRRQTPSAALERTARYVAAQLHAFGLAPGIRDGVGLSGEPSTIHWIQRYPVPGRKVQLDLAQTQVQFTYKAQPEGKREHVDVPFSVARFLVPRVPEPHDLVFFARFFGEQRPGTAVVLLTGPLTAKFLQQASLGDKTVLYLPPATLDSVGRQAIAAQLYAAAQGAVVLLDVDSAQWAAGQASAAHQPLQLDDLYMQRNPGTGARQWVAAVPMVVAQRILEASGVSGADLAAARQAQTPTERPLPAVQVELSEPALLPDSAARMTVPNVFGMLEGSDSVRKRQCLVVAAALDQPASSLPQDSLAHEAEARTGSLAGLLALAQAFGQLKTRPPYSVVFLAASGTADGESWGANAYWYTEGNLARCIPIATIALDPSVGAPAASDTVRIAGVTDVDVATSPLWIAGLHAELAVTAVDGGPVTEAHSIATTMARRGYPSLAIQAGATAAPAAWSDATVGRAIRRLQFAFYLSQELATATPVPQWSAVGRQRLLAVP